MPQLHRGINPTHDYLEQLCTSQLFEDQVRKTPDVCAVIYKEQRLTYNELNQYANQLAHYLRSLGIGPETCVGLYMERSVELIIGILGILKAGGAYIPLDPTYPKERLLLIMKDAQLAVLLTQERLLAGVQKHDVPTICLDSTWQLLVSWENCNLVHEAKAENLVYIIYTSGSTGQPKGVCCSHKNVLNLLFDFQQRWPIATGDGCSLWTNFSFDVSVYELFSALLTGGTLHLVPEDVRLEGNSFFSWLSSQQIRSTYIPHFMLADFRDWLQRNHSFCPLKRLLVGVEPISEQLLLEIQALLPNLYIINGYGPTETTICATLYCVTPKSVETRNTPIGRAVQNTQIYILDEQLQPVPIGSSGELYIGGAGVARGYLRYPELTAERFLPDPFSTIPEARLYKTGDLARYLPDGNIEFLGRKDHQIKLRGFRIELGEIEMILSHHPAVRDVVVEVREKQYGDKHLAAYVVTKDEIPFLNHQLRTFLQGYLPEYMIPSAFVQLEALPLTPNGKIDRRALPLPTLDQFEREEPFIAPHNDTEEKLVGIWKQVLGLGMISIHDNFFMLGGHSLLAMQVLARIRDSFQVDLPFRDFFDSPTVACIAEYIQVGQQAKKSNQISCFYSVDRTIDFSLSYAQQRLWFLDQWETNNIAYNLPHALRLIGPIDVSTLQQSLCEIMRRHEILRTTFKIARGQPIQVIATEASVLAFQLPMIDLTSYSRKEEREQIAIHFVIQESQNSFNLSEGPLMRVALLRLEKEDHIFLLTMHHIITDGWSMSILFHELNVLYDTYIHCKPSPLPDLPLQYADFTSWQRHWLQGEVMEMQLAYWKRQLNNAPEILQLPTDKPRPAVQSFHGSTVSFSFTTELTMALKVLSLREECTLFMILFAAFTILLYRYTGQDDLCLGTPIANRTHTEFEHLIGFFVNTLVLRTKLVETSTFLETLRNVRNMILEAFSHQDVPFERLVEEIKPKRDNSYHPLVQVMFVLQNTYETEFAFSDISTQPLEIDSVTSLFDITLELRENAQGLQGRFEYNTDLFDSLTIKRMADHFQVLLEKIIVHAEIPINAISLLTEAELQQLRLWNCTNVAYPDTPCAHQLFELQVQRTPDAIAIVFEDQQLTYQNLNMRANQLAYHLQMLGVKPEIPVGVCADRSIEMVIGLLGILKAGGVYIPLDPTYPQDRLAFMLEDAQVTVLLTQQQLLTKLSFYKQHIFCLDGENQVFAHCQRENHINSVTPKELAYIIYTSGSTGRPKGVMIEHKGLLNLIYWHQQAFSVTSSDKVTQIAGPAFDASIWEILPYLTIGASIYIPTEQTRRDILYLRNWLIEKSITISFLPTPLAERIIAVEWPHHIALRLLLTGGDRLRHCPPQSLPFTLVNNYGPTENTVVTTSGIVPAKQDCTTPSIGHPIANTYVYLLDHHLHPVSIGVPGELFIGGDSLARGYLNHSSLNKEKFITDPFSKDPHARLYKTGDLARFRHDGSIEFIGRIDNQVKIRGFRIELGEIETILCQHTNVRETVVIAREDSIHDSCLVAYIVLKQESPSSIAELRNYLRERIPDYMLPTTFLFLDAFPLTQNGKVDYKALPLPDYIRQSSTKDISTPSSMQEALAAIYAQVLEIEQVGIHDNFFEVGGHSLLTTQLVSLIYDTFQISVPLTQVFDTPTVYEMVQFIEKILSTNKILDQLTQ